MVSQVQIDRFVSDNNGVALVQIDAIKGSTPREVGAFMLVSAHDVLGTIGGGQLEYMAIDDARRAMRQSDLPTSKSVPLGPAIGQCCGGHVQFWIKRFGRAEQDEIFAQLATQANNQNHVFIFGAGHVGRALASSLAPLPLKVFLVDERSAELEQCKAQVQVMLHALPEQIVRDAPAGSSFVILTHDHALDFQITREALARHDAAYVGMIGSNTKRAVFEKWMREQDGDPSLLSRLICPIGDKKVESKRPEVIGALVAAQILVHTQNCEWVGIPQGLQQTANRESLDAI